MIAGYNLKQYDQPRQHKIDITYDLYNNAIEARERARVCVWGGGGGGVLACACFFGAICHYYLSLLHFGRVYGRIPGRTVLGEVYPVDA